jgi:hypothetical protein
MSTTAGISSVEPGSSEGVGVGVGDGLGLGEVEVGEGLGDGLGEGPDGVEVGEGVGDCAAAIPGAIKERAASAIEQQVRAAIGSRRTNTSSGESL